MTRPLKALLLGAGGLACTGFAPALQDLHWDRNITDGFCSLEMGLYLVGFAFCYASFIGFLREINQRCHNRPARHFTQALVCGLSGAVCFAAACMNNENRLCASTILALMGFGSGYLAANQLWQALHLRGVKQQDGSQPLLVGEERTP